MNRHILVVAVGLLLPLALRAHHALEYIEMESYFTPRRGGALFHVHYDYYVEDADNPDADHWEFTPGFSYGLTDCLMFDVHTHFAKFGREHVVEARREEYGESGPSPFLEAVAFSLQYRLPDQWPIQAGLAGKLEVPFRRARRLLGSEDHVFGGTLILNREFGSHGAVTLNVNYENEGGEEDWSWALGVRSPLSMDPHGIAGGVEISGDFEGNSWAVLPGVYLPIREGTVFKTGLQLGRQRAEEEWVGTLRLHTSLMYSF